MCESRQRDREQVLLRRIALFSAQTTILLAIATTKRIIDIASLKNQFFTTLQTARSMSSDD
jgi:hypothetical protein